MSKLTRCVALTVLASWSLASMHCKLEVLPGLGFLKSCCFVETKAPAPNACEDDGCAALEDGGYRSEEQTARAPQALATLASLPAAMEPPMPGLRAPSAAPSRPPPGLPRAWQFAFRTALPPRAPTHGA